MASANGVTEVIVVDVQYSESFAWRLVDGYTDLWRSSRHV